MGCAPEWLIWAPYMTLGLDSLRAPIRRSEIVRANYNMPACHATRPRGALPLLWANWIVVDDVTCRLQNGLSRLRTIIAKQITQPSSPVF
jgi:hypothetical protein